jgi:AcrR family transcriptional regulator
MQSDCINAVILQLVAEDVKRDRRSARKAETELRLVRAATALFVERGYAVTTLADVASLAGVAPRTVYVRFATKSDLLQRCIGVAIAGDAEPVELSERQWMKEAMTAPGADERISRMAAITAELMDRAGPLLDVAQQAAATEPAIAAAAQAGREDTRRVLNQFWRGMHDDGLLPPKCDIDWLAETATLLAHAETYLLLRKTIAWDIDTYRAWLESTWLRLAGAAAS